MRRFAVIGLGRFGQKLAIALAMSGAEVIAIDRNRNEVELIRDQVSLAVRLDGTDEEALKSQGVDKADVAIIALGQESFEAARWAYKLIAPQIGEKIDYAPGYSLARIKAPPSFDGKTVMDLQLRQKYNVNLVLIKRSDEARAKKTEKGPIINVPMPGTVVYQDDILMVAGSDADLASLPQE